MFCITDPQRLLKRNVSTAFSRCPIKLMTNSVIEKKAADIQGFRVQFYTSA